ncbi:hypothetical protein [Mesorhizobium sp. B2-3-4]|uniref:hypothetical protein n=1 Tax=Mesorhizobium sp. B2-3-4 TaxID=2589959 RepID=UPI001127FA8E|nr:hypothetical protein [Mesorhizobium sp. B2-3-4]TPM34164.1 hypothetical protein FJ967_22250 [Mesorhizobium sp. B2-3-4]
MRKLTNSYLPMLACAWLLCGLPARSETRPVPAGGQTCSLEVTKDATGTERFGSLSCPNDKQSVRVRYIWLDAGEVSYMLASYVDPGLKALWGADPIVADNDVVATLRDLYSKYGVRIASFSDEKDASHSIKIGNSDSSQSSDLSEETSRMPAKIRQKFRLPAFEADIIWPESDFLEGINKSGQWPGDYSYNYIFSTSKFADTKSGFVRQLEKAARKQNKDLARMLAECFRFKKNLSKSDWTSYWRRIDELASKETDNLSDAWKFVQESDDSYLLHSMSDSESYAFFDEITKISFPSDFLAVTGTLTNGELDVDQCGGDENAIDGNGGLNFVVKPPLLRVLVAVISPIGEGVIVKGASVVDDNTPGLRRDLHPDAHPRDMSLGDVALSAAQGQTMIIPLNIGFKLNSQSEQDDGDPSFDVYQDLSSVFVKYPDSQVNFQRCEPPVDDGGKSRGQCKPFLSQKLKDLPGQAVAQADVKPGDDKKIDYYYGVAHQLQSLEIGSQTVLVRDAPSLALTYSGIGEMGSCPFVYFEMNDGSVERYGRVLVGATSEALAKRDSVAIPEGARRAIIKELEPEVSFLSEVSFDAGEKMLGSATLVAAHRMVLRPRDAISIQIPAGARFVNVEGYYRRLTSN